MSIPITANLNTTSSTLLLSSTSTQKPTSAIVNIVFAIQYPVQPATLGLSTGAKAGIGAGAGVAGIAIVTPSLLLVWRTRKHKKDKAALTAIQATRLDLTGPSKSVMSSVSPYASSPRTELPTDSVNHPVQTPGSLVLHDQVGYFSQQQIQQSPPLQGYCGQQPVQYMQQVQGQPLVYYSTAPLQKQGPE